ncbi:hypothetical protein ACFPPA_03045 [Rhodanobacter ginsengisoli]|uniref:Uncharacterized protein n=1 Tax=Rhodanobacter ginsengisoli TaxID=418646 RepID=A0ABW0QJD0_9GAMM
MLKWLLPILGFWAFHATAAENDAPTQPPVYAGTYAVMFCQGSCPATTYRTGTLVLFDRPLRDAQGQARGKWLERGQINGCLTLDPVHGAPGGWVFYPGLAPRRFLVWSVVDDRSASFELDRTVDAGYTVELRLTPSGLGGTGMFWSDVGSPGTQTSPRQDAIQVHRIGDADPARCPRLDLDADAMNDVLTP